MTTTEIPTESDRITSTKSAKKALAANHVTLVDDLATVLATSPVEECQGPVLIGSITARGEGRTQSGRCTACGYAGTWPADDDESCRLHLASDATPLTHARQASAPAADDEQDVRVQRIPLALIDDNPDNPRDTIGDVSDLAHSIAHGGLLQPVLLVPKPVWRAGKDHMPDEHDTGRYVLIHGHRRRKAHELLDLEHIDAIVREQYVGAGGQIAMIVENFHREDLTSIQEAYAFQKLHELGLEQDQIAERVGCSQSHVSKRLGLLELPESVHALVLAKELTISDALELRPLAEDPKALTAALAKSKSTYGGVKAAVRNSLQASQEKERVRRVTEDLKAQGLRQVKAPDYFYSNGKMVKLSELVSGKRTTKAKHDKLKCHALAVVQRDGYGAKAGDVIPVCTSPEEHAAVASEARRAAKEAAAERERAAHLERLQHLKAVTSKPVKECTDYLLRALGESLRLDNVQAYELAELLGLDVHPSFDRSQIDELLEVFEEKGSLQLLRVILASQLLEEEHALMKSRSPDYNPWNKYNTRTDEYVAFMLARGFDISAPETDEDPTS